MGDLIWRETAPGVEEADGPGGARCIVERDGHGARVRVVLPKGGEVLVEDGFSGPYDVIARGKEWCGSICAWAASCGAAQDRAGRGEVGL